MQALDDGTTSRFAQGDQSDRDLLASAQTDDSVAVVLAGEPARVAVAPATALDLVKRTIEDRVPSDHRFGWHAGPRCIAGVGHASTATASRWVALALLGLVALELVVRVA